MREPHPALLLLGAQIRHQRRAKGMTQDVLSGLAGVTRASIANLEAGRQNPGFVLLADIVTALGITVAELVSTQAVPDAEAHEIVSHERVQKDRKIITYWCTKTGCETKGRISAIPHTTADGIFALAVKHHEEIEDHAGGA